MSFEDCLSRLVADGMSADKIDAVRAIYQKHLDETGGTGPSHRRAAQEKTVEQVRHEHAVRQRARLFAARFVQSADEMIEASPDVSDLARRVIEASVASRNSPLNVYSTQASYQRYFNKRLEQLLRHHSKDILGRTRDQARLDNVMRELHRDQTGDPQSAAVARAVADLQEEMRLMFNARGGSINKLDTYGVQHTHDRNALLNAGRDTWDEASRGPWRKAKAADRLAHSRDIWIDAIREDIAWHRITDYETGKPFARRPGEMPPIAAQRRLLTSVFNSIVTDGRSKSGATYGQPQGRAVYKHGSESRVLHFRDGDAWGRYNARFGGKDPLGTIMAHVNAMSRDIAQMDILGPNPGLGLRYIQDASARKLEREGDVQAGKNVAEDRLPQQMLDIITGANNTTAAGGQETVARFMSSTRSVLTSAFLDRAIIASTSDINTMRLAAQSVGMNPSGVFARHMELLASETSREEALRAGWIADTLADAGSALNRFQSEVVPAEFAHRLAAGVIRAQGLAFWTDMGRNAFQMEFAGFLAGFKSLDDMPPQTRLLMDRAGVTERDWADFTAELHTTTSGATFASPIKWLHSTSQPRARAEEIFQKIQSIFEEQMEFAVPTRNIYGQALILGTTEPGTFIGELARSGMSMKSFSITFTINHIRRMWAMQSGQERFGYFLHLAAGATVLGAAALILLDLASGREPTPMDTLNFWGNAMLKGGGFGILADILATGETSWGGGFAEYLAGPVAGAAQDVLSFTAGNVLEVAQGEDTNIGREFARLGNRYMPGGDLPFLGPAVDRLFWDQLQLLIDPEATEAMARAAAKRERDYGNGYYWPPGATMPDLGGGSSVPGIGGGGGIGLP